jgi:CubicO group peptidase (beta-lactamase class C family)
MKSHCILFTAFAFSLLPIQTVIADDELPPAFGGGVDEQEFYQPFRAEDITHDNAQTWPYYKYASANWGEFALFGTAEIGMSAQPAKLAMAAEEDRFDLNSEWKDGQSFIESFQSKQVKGFIVIKDNNILAEFYDNGFNVNNNNLLQSAGHTFVGVIIGQLVDDGLLDPGSRIDSYLKDFEGTDAGAATVQQVLDMTSGIPEMGDFRPGAPGHVYEIEMGSKPGTSSGLRNVIKSTAAVSSPGKAWFFTDKNTDTLAILAESVSGRKFSELLSDVFNAFGANNEGSVVLASDGSSAASIGISVSLRDMALFQQWLADRKGPASFYEAALDGTKTMLAGGGFGEIIQKDTPITYGSLTWYLKDHDVLMSYGSYGQFGLSDMKHGISVVYFEDWAVNNNLDKYFEIRKQALAVISKMRSRSVN